MLALLRRKLPWVYGAAAGVVAAAVPLWSLLCVLAAAILVVGAAAVDKMRATLPRGRRPADAALLPPRMAQTLGPAARRNLGPLGRAVLACLLAASIAVAAAGVAVALRLLSDRDLAPEQNGELFGELLSQRVPSVAVRLGAGFITGVLTVRWFRWVGGSTANAHQRTAPMVRRLERSGPAGFAAQWLGVPAAAALTAALLWHQPWAPYSSAEELWTTLSAPFSNEVADPSGRPQAAGLEGLLVRAGTLTQAAYGPILAVTRGCSGLDGAHRMLQAISEDRASLRAAAPALPVDRLAYGPQLRAALESSLDAERTSERAFADMGRAKIDADCAAGAGTSQQRSAMTSWDQAQKARRLLASAWSGVAGRYGLSGRDPSEV